MHTFLFSEVKLNAKDQLVLALEGNTVCEKNKKYSTDLMFTCDKNVSYIIEINI